MKEKYGNLYSLKVGSFKTVIAKDAASVKEVLVKKSADYAGRPPFHSFVMSTLGKFRITCLAKVGELEKTVGQVAAHVGGRGGIVTQLKSSTPPPPPGAR